MSKGHDACFGPRRRTPRRLPAPVVALAIVLVGAVALAGCASGKSPASAQTVTTAVGASGAGTTASSASSTTVPTVGPPAIAKTGEQVSVSDWKIKVGSVERKPEVDGVKATAGQEMLVVTFDVVNGSTRPVQLTREDFYLIQGKETYSPVDTRKGLFAMGPVAAGAEASTYLVFMVPVGSTGLKLSFWPFVGGYVTTGQAEISLD